MLGKLEVCGMSKICNWKISGKLEVWEISKIWNWKILGKLELWKFGKYEEGDDRKNLQGYTIKKILLLINRL